MELTRITKLLKLSIGILTFSFILACNVTDSPINANASANTTEGTTSIDEDALQTMPKEDLSDGETSGLIFMREEEKLARDVYITLFNKWGIRIFNNISNSEQKHTDAIKILLDKYELDDPFVNDSIGTFTNTILADLYSTLIAAGDSSLVEALKVGALIEEIDIIDLRRELEENVDNEDITYVYERLLNGSYNHIRAFVKNLSRQGITYSPVKLSNEEYLEIVNN